ncbi:hypothetical protein JCM3774_001947 [Rhodotorula dairenensis]
MPKAARAYRSAAAKHLRWSPASAFSTHSESRSHLDASQPRTETRKPAPRPRPRSPRRSAAAPTTVADWLPASLLRVQTADSTQPWTALDPSRMPLTAPALVTQTSDETVTLRLLTYNTFSADPSHTASQTAALLAVLDRAKADLVALQEVSEPFYRAVQRWAAAAAPAGRGWSMTSLREVWDVQGPEAHRLEGATGPRSTKRGQKEACVLLVRTALVGRGTEVRIAKLDRADHEDDNRRKAAIGFRLVHRGHEVLRLVTSHFSALPQNAALRSRQYRTCLSFLSSAYRGATGAPYDDPGTGTGPVCVLLGDMNASAPGELALISEPPLSLVDAYTLAPFRPPGPSGGQYPSKGTHIEQQGRIGQKAAAATATVSVSGEAETEASFRQRPTFGHLYPFVHASARGRPRKVRRIDRVYISAPAVSSSATLPSTAAAAAEGKAQARTRSPATVGVKVTSYEHLGGEPLAGPDERDRLGRGGRRFASDHEAVLVQLEVRLPSKQSPAGV